MKTFEQHITILKYNFVLESLLTLFFPRPNEYIILYIMNNNKSVKYHLIYLTVLSSLGTKRTKYHFIYVCIIKYTHLTHYKGQGVNDERNYGFLLITEILHNIFASR